METLAIIEELEKVYRSWGNIIIFSAGFIETLPIGFLIPGGLIISIGGFYSFGDKVSLVAVIISGSLGMLLAFILGYILGKKYGYALIKILKQEKNAELAKNLLNNYGVSILTTSLLASLTRFWVSSVAGIQKYNFIKFIFYAVIASLTWNSLFAIIGYLAGSERHQLESGVARLGILSYGLVLLAIGVIYWSIKKEYKRIKNN